MNFVHWFIDRLLCILYIFLQVCGGDVLREIARACYGSMVIQMRDDFIDPSVELLCAKQFFVFALFLITGFIQSKTLL